MTTRSKGIDLIPIDLEIEGSLRKKRREEETFKIDTPPSSPPDSPRNQDSTGDREVRRTLNDRFKPVVDQFQQGGWGTTDANNYEIKTSLINMVQDNQYGGTPMEDPNAHLKQFLDICAAYKVNGVSSEYLKLSLFVWSLKDDAREWLDGLDKTEIRTWTEMCTKFLNKFFPPSRDQKLINEINQFQQFEDEHFYEAWGRLKRLLRACSSHGISKENQITCFYRGLNKVCKKELDYASKRGFLNNEYDVAMEIIELIVNSSYEEATDRSIGRRRVATIGIDAYDDLMEKYTKTAKELDTIKKGVLFGV